MNGGALGEGCVSGSFVVRHVTKDAHRLHNQGGVQKPPALAGSRGRPVWDTVDRTHLVPLIHLFSPFLLQLPSGTAPYLSTLLSRYKRLLFDSLASVFT